ncbi:MAG: pyridoxamine 5'-phosphate oxidase family protein [Prevotellaceae bacterium]|nr:pyridoxamine 5'-phosphate oxidase family protein [Prevotellaceae bacterium]
MLPDSSVIEFIKKHHVLTLATCAGAVPYCSNMFYALLEKEFCLVFTSGKNTRHIMEATQNPFVAGSIVLETETVGKIQGLQFCGKMAEVSGQLKTRAVKAYLKRFPYAALSGMPVWIIEITYTKFTDNRLGFGKKLIWEKTGED